MTPVEWRGDFTTDGRFSMYSEHPRGERRWYRLDDLSPADREVYDRLDLDGSCDRRKVERQAQRIVDETTPRTLVRVVSAAAAHGQARRQRAHLNVPDPVHGFVTRKALCGAEPDHGFTRSGASTVPPERDCPRCYAKVRHADTIES